MSTDAWITFWEWAFLIGIGSFFLLVIAVIPLGARDLAALFRHLSQEADTLHDPPPDSSDE
jgi:hypothetical protein